MAGIHKEYGFSLPVVYYIWIGVVVMLYPLCRWYGAIKARRPYRALAYLLEALRHPS